MASAQDAVQRLQIETTSDGTDQATASLDKLAEAYGGVTVASTAVEKSTTSLDSKFASIEQRYNTQVKALSDYQKVQNTVNAAVSQNPALQDRANTVLAAAKQRYDDLTKTQSAFEKGIDAASEKAGELTHELGPLGTALTIIGPAGIAIGAALGVASLALEKLREQANEAGQWAAQLQNAAATIGLNTNQLQALNDAAATVGVSANDNISAFERFSASLGQLRDGSGQLYTQLLKVNPALVNQLSVTKDAATGWNLLSQAYSQADKQQQALIARAAFGKAGAAEGGVLLATANAGGISGLPNEDAVAQDQVKRWADLTTQINAATEAAQHNFQSIFAGQVLQDEKSFADGMLSISRAAKEFTVNADFKAFMDFLTNPTTLLVLSALTAAAAAGLGSTGVGLVPAALLASLSATLGAAGINGLISKKGASVAAEGQPLITGAAGLKQSGYNPDTSIVDDVAKNQATASLGVTAAQAQAAVSFLGSAATATDKYNASVAKLNVEVANNAELTPLQARALAGLQLDMATSQKNLYNSALGELATTSDLVAAKSLALQKDQQQGAGLTNQQITAVKNLTAANDEWTRVNGQAQIGVFDLAAATKAAGDQFQSWIDKGYLNPANPAQYAAAMQAMANKIQAASDAAKVAGSAFPQLTQLANDAGNINKQFDTAATTSLNDFSDALVSIGTGASSAGAAFQNFGLQVVGALEKMIIQMTIIKPLASSLSTSFGGSGGFFGSLFGGSSSSAALPLPGQGNFIGPVASAKGNIFANGNLLPFANGGTFTNSVVNSPTLFKFANGGSLGLMGEAGPEAIVPLKRGSDGNLGVASSGSGSVVVNVNVDNSSGSDVSVAQKKNSSGGVDLQVMVRKAVGQDIANGYHDKTMGARFGLKASGQKR